LYYPTLFSAIQHEVLGALLFFSGVNERAGLLLITHLQIPGHTLYIGQPLAVYASVTKFAIATRTIVADVFLCWTAFFPNVPEMFPFYYLAWNEQSARQPVAKIA
jgi:hypothetical protein